MRRFLSFLYSARVPLRRARRPDPRTPPAARRRLYMRALPPRPREDRAELGLARVRQRRTRGRLHCSPGCTMRSSCEALAARLLTARRSLVRVERDIGRLEVNLGSPSTIHPRAAADARASFTPRRGRQRPRNYEVSPRSEAVRREREQAVDHVFDAHRLSPRISGTSERVSIATKSLREGQLGCVVQLLDEGISSARAIGGAVQPTSRRCVLNVSSCPCRARSGRRWRSSMPRSAAPAKTSIIGYRRRERIDAPAIRASAGATRRTRSPRTRHPLAAVRPDALTRPPSDRCRAPRCWRRR